MGKTAIQWTDYTWNPVTGCTKVSEACQHCYAERMARRLAGRAGYPSDEPFRVILRPERLQELAGKKPGRVFVVSMGDLFHPDVPRSYIGLVWLAMMNAHQHTYQILTKRPERLLEWTRQLADMKGWPIEDIWPRNVWLGVTAENQARLEERWGYLAQVPAAVRFISAEPLLGPLDLGGKLRDHDWERGTPGGISWVIVGGETGPGARPMHPDWVRDIRDQCREAGVPFFFKRMGDAWRRSGQPEPEDLLVREFPRKVWDVDANS